MYPYTLQRQLSHVTMASYMYDTLNISSSISSYIHTYVTVSIQQIEILNSTKWGKYEAITCFHMFPHAGEYRQDYIVYVRHVSMSAISVYSVLTCNSSRPYQASHSYKPQFTADSKTSADFRTPIIKDVLAQQPLYNLIYD